MKTVRCLVLMMFVPLLALAADMPGRGLDRSVFKDPPAQYRGWAMWEMDLSKATEASVTASIRDLARKDNYGGFFMIGSHAGAQSLDPAYVKQAKPFFSLMDSGIEYLSDGFFRLYRAGLAEGKRDGLNAIFYDDYFFPTGTVCGQLYKTHPEHMAKRLDMAEKDVAGPGKVALPIPPGIFVGAVLMNKQTFERMDVSSGKTPANRVVCDVPAGNWKAMVFFLNTDAVLKIRNPGLMDYLDGAAVDAFLALSYDKVYAHTKDYFGSTIKMSFFDEPSLHWLDGRSWTASFNQNFEKKYGYSPMKLYPALWYDIGPETSAARNALYGFRAELFAAFVGKLNAWCSAHGIRLTGHVDQEEVPNPVPINGDLMKVFEHEAVPGADDVFWWGRSNRGYKVVTSASFNYDKPVTMTETYAAYKKLDDSILFRVAMDQYAQGVNFQCPSADIGSRTSKVPELNRYVGRLSYLLQGGRHVADIAILYPIASLQGCYKFRETGMEQERRGMMAHDVEATKAWLYAYNGGVAPPEIDYMDVGELLYHKLRVDYTYLHPEVLETRCTAANGRLTLNNKVNREQYRVLIVPGGDTLRLATARKIREFHDKGGVVIATSRLPFRSAESGHDKDVQEAVGAIFGIPADAVARGDLHINTATGYYATARNQAGGRAFFLPKPKVQTMQAVLAAVLPVRDVDIREALWPLKPGEAYDGALTYIHKVKDGRDIYFFANSSDRAVNTAVVLRGSKALSIWDPHTGQTGPAEYSRAGAVTKVKLALPPVSSRFYVQEPAGK